MVQPVSEALILPRGVRLARPEEIPAGNELSAGPAHLMTGFVVHVQPPEKQYVALLEVNVHAASIWPVFRDLVEALLPAAAALIVGVKDAEPEFGPYTSREAALNALDEHHEHLVHDGLMEFGMIFQSQGRMEEVFVPAAKYIRIWTNQPGTARAVLTRHGIPEVEHLAFLDHYPRVSETLLQPDGSAGWLPVLKALRVAFAQLPAPPAPGA